MTMKTKPFNHVAFIAGAKAVTLSGDRATYSARREGMHAMIDGVVIGPYDEQGRYHALPESRWNLFMLDEAMDEVPTFQETLGGLFDSAKAKMDEVFKDATATGGTIDQARQIAREAMDEVRGAFQTAFQSMDPRPEDPPYMPETPEFDDPKPVAGETWLADLADFNCGSDYKEVEVMRVLDCPARGQLVQLKYDTRPLMWVHATNLVVKL